MSSIIDQIAALTKYPTRGITASTQELLTLYGSLLAKLFAQLTDADKILRINSTLVTETIDERVIIENFFHLMERGLGNNLPPGVQELLKEYLRLRIKIMDNTFYKPDDTGTLQRVRKDLREVRVLLGLGGISISINPGWQNAHLHESPEEYTVMKGRILIAIADDQGESNVVIITVKTGETFTIPPGRPHNIYMDRGTVIQSIKPGRLSKKWERSEWLDQLTKMPSLQGFFSVPTDISLLLRGTGITVRHERLHRTGHLIDPFRVSVWAPSTSPTRGPRQPTGSAKPMRDLARLPRSE